MATNNFEIRLSHEEAAYMIGAAFLSPEQVELVRTAVLADQHAIRFSLLREQAEAFREAFTEQLARVGFDENYDITPEGRLLEDLIDRFYVD